MKTAASRHAYLRRAFYALIPLGMLLASEWAKCTAAPTPTPPPFPQIPNAIVPLNGKSLNINLGKYFPTPFVPTNAANAFPSNSVYVNTSMGDFYIQLFPTNAPITTANFLRYVTNGLYNGTTFHRSVTNFIVQTGSYDLFQNGSTISYNTIPTFPAITNEFGIPNTRGTIAMALGSDANMNTLPNSGTSGWFVNTVDNSTILDTTNNGPFTVFGQIVGTNGMAVIDAIAALPIGNYGSPFDALPLNHWSSNSITLAYTNLVTVTNMVAAIPSVACPSVNTFSVTLQGTNLVVEPLSTSTAPSTVYINTVDTNGVLFTKTFQVSTRKFPQTVSFSAPAYNYNYTFYSNAVYSLANYTTAVASGPSITASGLPVSFSVVSGPASITNVVTGGVTNSMIKLKGAGWVQLAAKQPGNTFYNPAPAATAWLQIYQNTNPITFPPIPNQTNGFAGPYTLPIATSNYPTALSGLPVTLTVKSGPAKALPIKGALGYALAITNTGTVTVVATQAGNANYYNALPVTNSFIVTP